MSRRSRSSPPSSRTLAGTSASLWHILWRDPQAFGLDEVRANSTALRAMTDPVTLRGFICDHMLSLALHLDFQFDSLTLRERVQVIYVDGPGRILSNEPALAPHTRVSSFEDYIKIMRLPTSIGDDICIAVFRHLFRLWTIQLDIAPDTDRLDRDDPDRMEDDFHSLTKSELLLIPSYSIGPSEEHVSVKGVPLEAIEEILHISPDGRQVSWAQLRPSSRMPVILIKDEHCRYLWAHAASDLWNDEPLEEISYQVLPPGIPSFPELLNPRFMSMRPDVPLIQPTLEEIRRPKPRPSILIAHDDQRRRQQVLALLREEFQMTAEQAVRVVQVYEQSGLKKANMQSLPGLRRIIDNMRVGLDPLSRPADAASARFASESSVQGKWARRNAGLRPPTDPVTLAAQLGPSQPEDIYCPRDMAMKEWRRQFQHYADTFSLSHNIPILMARGLIQAQLCASLIQQPIDLEEAHDAFRRAIAVRDVQQASPILSAPLKNASSGAAAVSSRRTIDPSCIVQDTAADFIEANLGAGVRVMTMLELIKFQTATQSSHVAGKEVIPAPDHLQDFWTCYVYARCENDPSNRPVREVFTANYRQACVKLHQMACKKAAANRKAASANNVNASIYSEFEEAPAPAQAQEAPAPAQASALAHAHVPNCGHCGQHQHTRNHSSHTALLKSMQPAQEAPPASPARPLALFQTPQHVASPPAATQSSQLQTASSPTTLSSPFARLAADREMRSIAAKASAQTLIIMPNNSSKIMQWKLGDEKDGKGFYWSTKLAVQQSWEQHNLVEEPQNYKTFRSTIHVTMISIICIELKISRQNFDVISDADLIEKLDAKLKPAGPLEYLLKLRQIKFNNDSGNDTLLHRYRAFAEPFLQLVSESTEAGCDINPESVKLAFKAACKGNELLMTFFQEGKWQGVHDAHQRIVAQLKIFDSLQTMQSLNTSSQAPSRPTFVAPQPQYQIAPPPPAQIHVPIKHYQAPPRQQSAMVNIMNQMMSRFDQLERNQADSIAANNAAAVAPPTFSTTAAPGALVNFGQATPSMSLPPLQRKPVVHDLTPHPGLDARGPYWHPSPEHFACRYTPCVICFCQGCGRHGHTSAECVRKSQPGWNISGYYADRYPGQGALSYTVAQPSPQSAGAPHRITTPAAAPSFPTPFRTNMAGGGNTPAPPQQRYTPVVRNNNSQTVRFAAEVADPAQAATPTGE